MAEHSIRRRLVEERAETGISGVYRMAADYVRWRVHGSPINAVEHDVPSLADWMESYSSLRPALSLRNPETGFSIICPVYNSRSHLLEECVESVIGQTHQDWELILVDDASTFAATREALVEARKRDRRIRVVALEERAGVANATNAGIAAAVEEYVVFIDHDDRLAPCGLEWMSTCCPRADLIYTDEDQITEEGVRSEALFKPSWSPRLLLGLNYVSHITCVRTALLREVGGVLPGTDGVQDHDLLLRISERDIRVAHVPYVAYHRRAFSELLASNPTFDMETEARGVEMVQRAIDRRGWNARATLGDGTPFNYRVVFNKLVPRPLVKIVIPTRDHLRMLRQVVGGVLNRTEGLDVKLVIVDNGSKKSGTLAYLDQLTHDHDEVTILRIDDAFNFSKLCNAGAAAGSETPYLLFLNNDIEVLHRNWLQQLVGWLDADPGVVGVGAKLLFPDRTIQHAGVIVGFRGIAGHYAARERNQPRSGSHHDQAREVAGLTAACLLVRSADFDAVGGFNESLHVDFQDVDLCLRLRNELGGELVYDPTYPMIHLESATRGPIGSPSGYTVARMQFLWGDLLAAEDPYYSPHLSLDRHDFSLRRIPEHQDDLRHKLEARWTKSPSVSKRAMADPRISMDKSRAQLES